MRYKMVQLMSAVKHTEAVWKNATGIIESGSQPVCCIEARLQFRLSDVSHGILLSRLFFCVETGSGCEGKLNG